MLPEVISSGFVNITQELDISKYPFRRNRLDYSHVENAEVLTAIAASLLLWLLTASLVHFTALMLGMTVRSIIVRSHMERYLLPNIIGITRSFSNRPKIKARVTNYRITQLIAGSVLVLLLMADLLVIFSGSPRQKRFKLEDLHIKIPHFSPYGGDVRYSDIKDHILSLISSGPSVSLHPLLSRVVEVKQPGNYSRGILVAFAYLTNPNAVLLGCYAGDSSTWIFTTETRTDDDKPVFLFVNPRHMLNDTKKMAMWTGRHAKDIYNCSNELAFGDSLDETMENITDVKGLFVYDCQNNFSDACNDTVKKVIFGSLSLSDSFLSRQHFVASVVVVEDIPVSSRSVDNSEIQIWDRFAELQTTRVPGFILWICVFVLLMSNILLGSLAPDVQLAQGVALSQRLHLESIPVRLQNHVVFSQEQKKLNI